MSRANSLFVAAQAMVSVLVLVPSAGADGGDDSEARALQLFMEGRTEMRNGHYAEACPKFADSKTLDPGGGTMLNLAYCYEKLGKRARAWAEYQAAAVAAHRDGKTEWESAALARAGRLESTLGWVVVHLEGPSDASNLDIRVDGDAFAMSLLERSAPIDPGQHEVRVTAVGKRPWSSTFEVDDRHVSTIAVPPLEAVPAPALVPLKQGVPVGETLTGTRRGLGPQRITAIAVAGVGAASLGVALGYALSSLSTYGGADCQGNACTRDGASVRTRAFDQSYVASAALATGLASLAGATLLWWTAPSQRHAVHLEPTVGKAACGLSVDGAW